MTGNNVLCIPKGAKILSYVHKTESRNFLGALFIISDKHPRPFHMGVPPWDNPVLQRQLEIASQPQSQLRLGGDMPSRKEKEKKDIQLQALLVFNNFTFGCPLGHQRIHN